MSEPGFVFGVIFGALSLFVLLGVGIWIGRRSVIGRSQALDSYHVEKVLQGLHSWTDGFAHDVSRYRKFVDGIQEQMAAAEHQSPQADPAWMVKLLSRIVQANEHLQRRLDTAELTLQEQASEITSYMSEARTDPLTGLSNRRVFDDELSRQVAEYRRHGTPLSVLIVDIDHFKKFNDRYGHLAGDAVLTYIAGILRGAMRETDLVARLGGEEFAVLLPGTDGAEAGLAAERIRVSVARAMLEYEGKRLRVTISCGGAGATAGEEPESIIKRADQALYASKAAGRDFAYWHNGLDLVAITVRAAKVSPRPDRPLGNSEEFSRVCDELRRKLLAVVGSDA